MNEDELLRAALERLRKLLDAPTPPWWRFRARRERERAIDRAVMTVSVLNRRRLGRREGS